MGWLDKIAKVVQEVTEEVSATAGGAIDSVRGTGQPGSTPSTAIGPLTGSPDEIVAEAVARGLVDVGRFITVEEASQLLGTPVGWPVHTVENDWVGWRWETSDGQVVDVKAAFDVNKGTRPEPTELWSIVSGLPGATPVDDVDQWMVERAVRVGDTFYGQLYDDTICASGHPRAKDLLQGVFGYLYDWFHR